MTTQTGSLTLKRGKLTRPQKAVIYGPEGVGKSTLASQFTEPVFLDTEGGTHHLDVVRFPDAATWDDITAAIAQLASGEHSFKTLVIDTADWLEKRLAEHICRKANKESIEDFGYGKGYTLLAEEFAKFLASLDGLIRRGMHVVLLAHSTVRKFESPDQAGSYDRYELKLSKQVGPLLKEWADLILFANYVTKVAESESGRKRGVGGREPGRVGQVEIQVDPAFEGVVGLGGLCGRQRLREFRVVHSRGRAAADQHPHCCHPHERRSPAQGRASCLASIDETDAQSVTPSATSRYSSIWSKFM